MIAASFSELGAHHFVPTIRSIHVNYITSILDVEQSSMLKGGSRYFGFMEKLNRKQN